MPFSASSIKLTFLTQGINAQDITKLKAAGIVTVLGVAQTTRRHLMKIKGLSEDVVAKLLPPPFQSGTEVAERRQSVVYITTGSKSVDAMLGGGIPTQSITEVFGEYRTGKTQLCHTLCVSTQLPEDQFGASGKVAYIDTEGTFRPDRVKSVADRFGVDATMALDNVLCARAWSSEQQCDLLVELAVRFVEDRTYKLIIVDSIMNLFRQDYSGRGELSERQQAVDQKLNQFLARLQKLAEEFNVAVVLTNQVQSDPGVSDTCRSALADSHSLAHILLRSAVRMQLRKGRGDERIAKLQDSPDMPEGEATYVLKSGGWEDPS
uniref:Meiotic recombinase Dmc1 n=1 Tax=Kwoniella pini CBS 10737 TaxID=1296096 RepID=A0A1B9HTB4_9TREE|nr:meiotic recombinase Dmc1 [Kwoniella pini CBS 10737]OCF46507.1 meiotic recombinase Dmc1 [Kwoniella pini CBS 10737]